MRRRICAAVLFVLLAAAFTCCAAQDAPDVPDGEYDTVVMTYQTMQGGNITGIDEVVEAINAITRETIGAEIELRLVDAVDAASDYPVWLSQGQRIDLLVLNYLDITGYVGNKYLTPLDGLLEKYGGGILELREQGWDVNGGAVIDGEIYGVNPLSETRGSGGGLWIPVRYLRETGFAFDPDRIYTMEELDSLFASLKKLYPDSYPLGQITTDRSFSSFSLFYGSGRWIAAADSVDSGVLDGGEGAFVNFYGTEEYREFLGWMRRWYKAGYILPDAAVTNLSASELLKSGIVLSVPTSSMPGMVSDAAGEEVVCLMTSPVTYGPNNASTGIRWVIPASAGEPEAAMKFLNLMYTDERIINLLAWGIEGRDYVFVDREAGVIELPEDGVQYENPLGLYGNTTKRYMQGSDELRRLQIAYNEKAVPVGMRFEGFTFDVSQLTAERSLIRQVLNRYLPVLESGSVDIDEVYPEFMAALEEAGLDRVIAEKQRQLESFLKTNS